MFQGEILRVGMNSHHPHQAGKDSTFHYKLLLSFAPKNLG